MALSIKFPIANSDARKYLLDVVFGEFLGLKFNAFAEERDDWEIASEGDAKSIRILDTIMSEEFSDLEHIKTACANLRVARSSDISRLVPNLDEALSFLPIIGESADAKDPKACVAIGSEGATIEFDLLGVCFFMLSRMEEVACSRRDQYSRFSSHDSLARNEGFLERPIVDEYIELLWALMRQFWPQLERRPRTGSVRYTCDIDTPFDPAIASSKELLLRLSADLIKRRNLNAARARLDNRKRALQGDFSQDPNNQFDWLLRLVRDLDTRSCFYILSSDRMKKGSGWYRLNDPFIAKTLSKIASEGHELGLHGTFGSCRDGQQLKDEKRRLEEALNSIGHSRVIVSNRQHFLQWETTETPDLLETAGFQFDSSGGYHDKAGFRYGTARPFSMWSWKSKRKLNLKQRPLIVMESSLLDARYQNLNHFPDALDFALDLKRKSLRFGGDFTLLWHNSYLTTDEDKRLLESILTN